MKWDLFKALRIAPHTLWALKKYFFIINSVYSQYRLLVKIVDCANGKNLPTPFSKHMEMLDKIFLKIGFQFLVEFGSKKESSLGVRNEGTNI